MRHAIKLAQRAFEQGEVPIGAVLIAQNKILGEGWNQPISSHDPTAHAEIMALRHAGNTIKNYRIIGATLYTTLEPCAMCAGALIHARIDRLVYGARDPKSGAVESVFSLLNHSALNHRVVTQGGIHSQACAELLQNFFKFRR